MDMAYRRCNAWEPNWDGRHDTRPTSRRTLLLVRHGQYHLADADKGTLTELGHEQARQVGERLARLSAETPFAVSKIIHSDMPRAVQTTEAIGTHLRGHEHTCMPELAEGRPCVPEPSRSARKWSAEQLEADGPRIERGFRALVRRASETVAEDETIVVVCHANVIRYFVCRALQLPPEAWLRMSLAHCSITSLVIQPNGRVSLRSFGDAGHLPPRSITR